MSLTHFELNILSVLSAKPRGEVTPYAELNEALYGGVLGKEPPKSNSLQVIIARMRRKGCPAITAVRGKGYKLGNEHGHTDQSSHSGTLAGTSEA